MLEHQSSRMGLTWRMLFGATAVTCACGIPPPAPKVTPQAVLAAPSPVKLLSWIAVEVQDTLAAALPEGACVTQTGQSQASQAALADKAMGLEPTPDASWRFDACEAGGAGISLSGERHLWASQDAAGGAKMRSRFAYARSRADGARWLAEGQAEVSSPQGMGQVAEQRALSHGSMTPSGQGVAPASAHAYAYHLRIVEGLDGVGTRRLSGVAQLNFGTLETTSQVKLASLIWAPGCLWPVYGHVSVATTASDGSWVDASLVFTEWCGVVKDDQGALTPLTMPWEEGA